jgi:hypothetical protein
MEESKNGEKPQIIRKALTPEEAAKLDEVFKNAPTVANFEHAEIKQQKNTDGSASFTLNFRQRLKDRLLLELALLKGSSNFTEQQKELLTAFHGYIKATVEDIKAVKIKDGTQLNLYPYPEVLQTDAEWQYKIKEILDEAPVKSILSRLLPEKRRKKKDIIPDGIPSSVDNITYSTAYVQQHFNTPKRRQAQQAVLPLAAAEDYAQKTGIALQDKKKNELTKYGIELTEWQDKAVKAISQAFTATDYKGNTDSIYADELLPKADALTADIPAFKNIDKLPRIRLTQAQYLELCGVDKEKQSDKQNALEALNFLGTEQFVFWWQRLIMEKITYSDKTGKKRTKKQEARHADGTPQLEDVTAIGTLYYIKRVNHKDIDTLNYYEIAPSPVMLDRLNERYGDSADFLIYPYKLEREIQQTTGKRLKKLEAKFMLWLTWKYEEQRKYRLTLARHGNEAALSKLPERPEKVEIDWKGLAIELNVPDSQLKKKQKTVYKRLESAYIIAQKAGFLKEYKLEKDGTIKLFFNSAAYFIPDWQKEKADR